MISWDEIDNKINSISKERKLEIEIAAYLIEKIIDRRRELRLTQSELANKVNMTQSQIARLENHNSIPKLNTLIAIANALNLEIKLAEKEQSAALMYY